MLAPRKNLTLLQEQVTGKVHWGAGEREILTWLKEEKGIVGGEAEDMFAVAMKERSKEVRGRAIMMLIFSGIGVCLVGGFVALQWASGFVLVGKAPFIVFGLGLLSLGIFVRSLYRLLTGRSNAPID